MKKLTTNERKYTLKSLEKYIIPKFNQLNKTYEDLNCIINFKTGYIEVEFNQQIYYVYITLKNNKKYYKCFYHDYFFEVPAKRNYSGFKFVLSTLHRREIMWS